MNSCQLGKNLLTRVTRVLGSISGPAKCFQYVYAHFSLPITTYIYLTCRQLRDHAQYSLYHFKQNVHCILKMNWSIIYTVNTWKSAPTYITNNHAFYIQYYTRVKIVFHLIANCINSPILVMSWINIYWTMIINW